MMIRDVSGWIKTTEGIGMKELPQCPHCDNTMKPERIGAGRYICDCCARIFIVPKGT